MQLIDMLEEMIHEQLDLIDKEELNNYIKGFCCKVF